MRSCLPGKRPEAFAVVFMATALGRAEASAIERCAGQTFALITASGGHAPYIQLNAGGRSGAFQLDYDPQGERVWIPAPRAGD